MSGTLYVVATPIGNLEDITLRAVRILGEVDGIAAEDTRHTRKLLSHLGLHKPLLSLHQHNEKERVSLLRDKLLRGESWALVSDAGTPGICDPGAQLVGALRAAGCAVVPLPGACALATALSVSGLIDARFQFEGFLPPAGAARKARLAAIAACPYPVVLYESPHRVQKTLQALFALTGERRLTLMRELTKLHEEVLDLPLSEGLERTQNARGEYVLLLYPAEAAPPCETEGKDLLFSLLDQGLPQKQALEQAAAATGLRKNQLYAWCLEWKHR